MKSVAFGLLVLSAAVLSTANQAAADIIISGGDLSATSWGPGHGSYGQTFTVPVGESFLLEYTFTISSSNDSFPYVSQVYAWNGDQAIDGSALFTSDVLLSPEPADGFTEVTFSPGIAVTAGAQYIALVTNMPGGVSVGGPTDGSVGGSMFHVQGNPYSEGRFFFKGGNPEVGNWDYIAFEPDAVFRANFATAAVVPEASSVAAWAIAVGAMLLAARAAALITRENPLVNGCN